MWPYPPTAQSSPQSASQPSRRPPEELPSELYPQPKIRWYPNIEEHPSIWNATGLQQPGRPAKPPPAPQGTSGGGGFLVASVASAHGLEPAGEVGSGRYRVCAFYQSEAGLPNLEERKSQASAASRGAVANREDCTFGRDIRVPFSAREQFLKVAVFRVDGTLDLLVGEATVPIADPEVSNTCAWPLLRDFEQQGLVKMSVRLPDGDEEAASEPAAVPAAAATSSAAPASEFPFSVAPASAAPAAAASPSAAASAAAPVVLPLAAVATPSAAPPAVAAAPPPSAAPPMAAGPLSAAPSRSASAIVPASRAGPAAAAAAAAPAAAGAEAEGREAGGEPPPPPPPPRRPGGPAALDCATPQAAGYPQSGGQWRYRPPVGVSQLADCNSPKAFTTAVGSPQGTPSHAAYSPTGAQSPGAAALGIVLGGELEVYSKSNGQWLRAKVSRIETFKVTVEYTDRFGDRFKVVDLRAHNLHDHLRFPFAERGDASPESLLNGPRSRSTRPLAEAAPSWAPPAVQASAAPAPSHAASSSATPSHIDSRWQAVPVSGADSWPVRPLLQAFGFGPAKPAPAPAPVCERIWGAQTAQRPLSK